MPRVTGLTEKASGWVAFSPTCTCVSQRRILSKSEGTKMSGIGYKPLQHLEASSPYTIHLFFSFGMYFKRYVGLHARQRVNSVRGSVFVHFRPTEPPVKRQHVPIVSRRVVIW